MKRLGEAGILAGIECQDIYPLRAGTLNDAAFRIAPPCPAPGPLNVTPREAYCVLSGDVATKAIGAVSGLPTASVSKLIVTAHVDDE